MNRHALFRSTMVALATLAAGFAAAAQLPARPAKHEVPFSALQNFIDHARFFKEETIQVGPYKIWNFNTPNRGFGNVIVVEGEKELVVIDTNVALR
jgi:hypothetical protein